tara:strand:+ start:1621 stop:3471 length:1851 start_codon:yes stop_codon:yes gene_type:complete
MAENVKIVIKALDKTKGAFGGVNAALNKLAGTASKAGKAVALLGTVAAASFVAITVSNLKAIDSLAKTAKKIGTTTESLSALRFAANISGVEITTLDMALQRFTRRLAEAAKGTGEAKGALKELNIDAKELMKLPLDEQMLVLSDRFENVKSSADKVRLAMKLFDSEGVALVNTLALGADGMKELMQEAATLGLVMSSDAAEGVERANDAFTKLLSLFTGMGRQMTAGLAPAIEAIADLLKNKFLKSIEDAGGSVEEFGRSMAVGFIESAKTTVKAGATIANAVIKTYNAMITAKTAWDSLMGKTNIDTVTAEIAKIDELLDKSGSKLMNTLSRSIVGGNTGGFFNFLDDEELNAIKEPLVALLKELQAEGKTSSLVDLVDPAGFLAGLEVAIQAVEGYKSAVDAVVVKNIEVTDSFVDVKQAFSDWQQTVLSGSEIVQSFTNSALNGMTDALTAGITGAAKFSDAMKSMAKSVIDSLIKMLVQKYIVDAAFGFITGAISGPSGFTGGGSGTPSFDARGHAAIGGPLQSGSPYMVGERGPEMFVPNSQGSIIPNNKLNGESGGVTVNQTINVTTGIQQTVRAEIATLMPAIANAAKGAVADARQRGGGFSKALVGG